MQKLKGSSVFISCGEVSGDMYAADFVRELLAQAPEFKGHVWGMTGPQTDAALELFNDDLPRWSYEELKLMGILEVLPSVPRLLRLRRTMIRAIMRYSPAAAVLVDSPDYHLGLASGLRRAGYRGKLVCLITPTVWAWREGRVKILRECFDLNLPLFSFEHQFLTERGVNSAWTAHPLVWELRDFDRLFNRRFLRRVPGELTNRIGDGKEIGKEIAIAFMPGSRRYDIAYHLDTLIGAANIMRDNGYLPIFSIAPGLSRSLKDELTDRLAVQKFETWRGEGRELMAACAAVAGVSGTVAVEAMLLRRFMTVIYNMNPISYAILKRLVHVRNISIPNMLTDKPVFPELLCGDANPARITDELMKYLGDSDLRADTDRRLEAAREAMGDGKASEFWASCVLSA